ncbi:hypothetical protein ACOQNK_17730 [Acinetobacter baumannii]|uniref:hypothetical protein n=1 Tax=Acinetobacter baumannii TaxID=470 RepID=UPI003BAA9ECB
MVTHFISDKEFIGLTFDDFYRRKIDVIQISLGRNAGIAIDKWLSANGHLVLHSSTSSTKSKWGREGSHDRDTAFFKVENKTSDGTPDGCLIKPAYKLPLSLTTDQISQTPTLIELYFGILKKYPEEVHHILCNIQDDLDDRAYLEWMHPKSLLKNK